MKIEIYGAGTHWYYTIYQSGDMYCTGIGESLDDVINKIKDVL